MSIFYDTMSESWKDESDDDFKVSMTPEGSEEDMDKTFETQEEFWKWYNA